MVDPIEVPVAAPGYISEPPALKALVHPLRLQSCPSVILTRLRL